MSFNLKDVQNAIIFGAGRGIGTAIVGELLVQCSKIEVTGTFRSRKRAEDLFRLQEEFKGRLKVEQIDPINESELEALAKSFSHKKIDLLINCIGLLHSDYVIPEKSLRDINAEKLLENFKVNSILTPLLAKYFHPLFPKSSPSCFVALSAKVGSIEDNRLGGWYGYRSSKAALNMFLKNIAIEFQRRKLKTQVFAIHPGTTTTELSKPFVKNTNYKLHTPEETAKNILKVLDQSVFSEEAKFLSWDGEELAW